MVVRSRIAQRLPILKEIAVPARIVRQEFVEPYVGARLPELRGILAKLPTFSYGEAYGEVAGQWYRVAYPKPIKGATPVCVARGRTGTIITRPIDKIATERVSPPEKIGVSPVPALEKIIVPEIPAPTKVVAAVVSKITKIGASAVAKIDKVVASTVAKVEKVGAAKIATFEIPRVGIGTKDEVGRTIGDAYYNAAKERLGDWKFGLTVGPFWVGVDINWIRDGVASLAWALGYITGVWIHWLYTILVQPQIDKVRDAVNKAISDQVDRINSAFATQMDKVDARIEQLRLNANDALSAQMDRVDARVDQMRANVNAAFSTQMDRVDDRIEELRARANEALSAQTDRINDTLQGLRNGVNDVLAILGIEPIENLRVNVNAAFSVQVDRINDSLIGLVDNINAATSVQMDRVRERVNLSLSDLYIMWGIPENMAVTAAHTRNETDDGFDFQSFGETTIHYISVGSGYSVVP